MVADCLKDTQADKDEQLRIFLALNNAIPVSCQYRNLYIALAQLMGDISRAEHRESEEHAGEGTQWRT